MASKKNGKNVEMSTLSAAEPLPSQKKVQQSKFWNIDKEMLRLKVHYFFFSGAVGVSLPYLTIFAQSRVSISASAIGVILTATICISIISRPFIGYLADYFNKLKAIICVLSVTTIVSFFLLLAIPKIKKGMQEVTPNHVVANEPFCKTLFTSQVNDLSGIRENGKSQLEDILHFNNSNISSIRCFPPPTNFPNFFSECSRSNKKSLENTSNLLEDLGDMEQKYTFSKGNASSQPDSVSCEACCLLSGECISIECQVPKNSTEEISIEGKPVDDFRTYQFWLYAIIVSISITCINSSTTLTDTVCCETVQKSGAQFGRQKLWGAIGWGLLSPISGFFIDITGGFLASWILMAILSFIVLLNMIGFKIDKPQFSKNLIRDVGTVLASKEFLSFKFCVLINGIGAGFILFYLFLFLTNIGGSRLLCGLVNFVQSCVGKIPFMFFSDWAIKKLGHFNLQTLALLAYCIRFFWYSQLHNPWLVLPAEVLHGFTFGLFYPNVASFAKLSAKPGTEATTQAILFTAHEGVGIGIGCIVAGVGFDTVGDHATFLYMSIFCGFAMFLSIVLSLLFRQGKGSINKTQSIDM